MALIPTPEDALGPMAGPPLSLKLVCKVCRASLDLEFEWACVHPDVKACNSEGWDGVVLSRIVECQACHSVDDYELSPASKAKLTDPLPRALSGGGDRVISARMELWDGTVGRRPSHALAHLRRLAQEQPNRAEAHRRLGNACERFGTIEEAALAWRRAVEVDPRDIDSAASLVNLLMLRPETVAEGFALLQRAVDAAPSAPFPDPDTRRHAVSVLFSVVRQIAERAGPLSLMACWRSGITPQGPVLRMSGVDLKRVLHLWPRLVDFVLTVPDLKLGLTASPAEKHTQLEQLLVDGELPRAPLSSARPTPSAPGPRIGRNDRCPCGSGQKYKRCCAGQPQPGAPQQRL